MRRLSMVVLLLLAGCATLNQPECQAVQANPAQKGLADGKAGYGLWRLDKHVESCARFGITFDRSAYLAARDQGLLQYCTPENGQIIGARGESYENVCPAAMEPAFLKTYRPAYREYQIDRAGNNDSMFWPRRF